MQLFVFCFVELVFLFFLSREVTKRISQFLFTVTRNESLTIHLLFWIFSPGIIIHELSHFFAASLLFVPVGSIAFIPTSTRDGARMGTVSIGKTDPLRRALVGVAPFIVGMVIILGVLYYLSISSFQPAYFNAIAAGILVFEIGNTMFSSRKDIEGTLELLLVSALFFIVFSLMGLRIQIPWDILNTPVVTAILKQSVNFLAIPVIVDLLLIGIFSFILRSR